MSSKTKILREKISIAAFVAPYTNGLKASGRHWFTGRCPFHQSGDDPPGKRKFWVNTKLQICGCFVPRCPAYSNRKKDPGPPPMDAINFWARLQGISNSEAITQLWEEYGGK